MKKLLLIAATCLVAFISQAQAPSILSATWYDTDSNGNIDQVDLSFDVEVDVTDPNDGFDAIIVAQGATIITLDDVLDVGVNNLAIGASITITFVDDQIFGTDIDELSISYSEVGAASITNSGGTFDEINDGESANNYSDAAAPQLIDFEYQDQNNDGLVDQFLVSFSEEVTAASSLAQSNFDLTNAGSFDGMDFGSDGTDLITSSLSSVLIPVSSSSEPSTFESSGQLAISTTGSFNLTDAAGNSNSTSRIQAQASIIDGAPPVIVQARTLDSDTNGQIDGLQIVFSEPIDDDISVLDASTISVSGYGGVSTTTGETADDAIVEVTFDESGSVDTDQMPTVTRNMVAIQDFSTNDFGNSRVFGLSEDGAGPALVSAVTRDDDENGYIDQLTLTFSESIDDSESGPFDFSTLSVFGYVSVSKVSSDDDDDEVVVSFNESGSPDTDATPDVLVLAGQVVDLSPSQNTSPTQNFVATADGAGPAVIEAVTNDLDNNGRIDAISVIFSENIDQTSFSEDGDDFSVPVPYNISSASLPTENSVNIVLEELMIPNTGAIPTLTLNSDEIQDAVGNQIEEDQEFLTSDGASPVIVEMQLFDNTMPPDGYIDRMLFTWSENIDTDDGAIPILQDFGVIRLPDGEVVTTGTISDTDGGGNTVEISGIGDQLIQNTAVGLTSLANFPAVEWQDAQENFNKSAAVASTEVLDEAAPVITSFRYEDADSDGRIDQFTIGFSELVDASASQMALQNLDVLDDGSFSDIAFDDSNSDNLFGSTNVEEITVGLANEAPDAITFDASGSLEIAISGLGFSLTDLSMNSNTAVGEQPQASYVDGASPVLTTVTTFDATGNGEIDQLRLIFSEEIASSTLDFSSNVSGNTDDFDIDSHAILSSNTEAGSDEIVFINIAESGMPDTDATPGLTILATSSIADEAGNTIVEATHNAVDAAVPVIYSTSMHQSNAFLEVTFSEPIRRESGGDLSLEAFGITTNTSGDPNAEEISLTELLNEDGSPVGIVANALLFGLDVVPSVGSYDGANDWVNVTMSGPTIEDLVGLEVPGTETTGNVGLNSVLVSPQIIQTEWMTTNPDPANFQGYLELTFSEALSRDFETDRSPRLSNTAADGQIVVSEYTNGDGDCTDGELCVGYDDNGGVSIGDDNPADISWRRGDGSALNHDDNYSGNTYRLYLDDISGPFIGVETYTFTTLNGLQVRGRTSGNYLPSSYESTFQFPDLVPTTFNTAIFQDVNTNGIADRVVISIVGESFDDSSVQPSDFQMGAVPLNSFISDGTPNNNTIILSLEGLNLDGSEELQLSYTDNDDGLDLTDLDGNQLPSSTILVVDNVGPIIVSATTLDVDMNGRIDAIDVQFTESVDDSSLDTVDPITEDFAIAGYTILGYSDPAGAGMGANDQHLRILLDEVDFDTDHTPTIVMNLGQVSDASPQAFSLPVNQTFDEVVDGASPVILAVSVDDGSDPTMADEHQLSFQEVPTFTMVTSEPVLASLDISSAVAGKSNELMGDPVDEIDGSHTYTYMPSENGGGMSNGLGQGIIFSANDGVHETVNDLSISLDIDNVVPVVRIDELETNSTSPLLTGSVTDYIDAIITVSLNGGAYQEAENLGNGNWQLQGSAFGALTPQVYDLDALVQDPFGNQSSNINDTEVELQIGGTEINPPPVLDVVCIDGGVVPLGAIEIAETKANDFKIGQDRTFFIQIPDGLEFEVSTSPTEEGLNPDISAIAFEFLGTQTLRVTLDIDSESSLDVISIQGLQLIATSTPGTKNATFLNGTASFFNIANGSTLASINSVSPPNPPQIMVGGSSGQIVTEVEVNVNNEDFRLFTSDTGFGYNWYNYAGLLIHTGSSASMLDLSDVGGQDGFDITTAGLYTLYVGEENSQGCESALREINVYVYDLTLNPETFNFVSSDFSGVEISLMNNPEDFTGTFLGPGLINVSAETNPALAQFVPGIIGAGTYDITFSVVNNLSLRSYDFTRTFLVNPASSIFQNGLDVQAAYCNNEAVVTLDAELADIPIAGSTSPESFYFYGLELRNRSTNEVIENVLVPPVDWSAEIPAGGLTEHKPSEGWLIDPADGDLDLSSGEYTIVRRTIPESGLSQLAVQDFNSFDITINPSPEAQIQLDRQYLCEDDSPIELQATLDGFLNVNVLGFTVTDLSNGNGSILVSGNLFNPGNPMGIAAGFENGAYPVGSYQLDYQSSPSDNENGCTDDAVSIFIDVLAKPGAVSLDLTNDVLSGHGQQIDGSYFFEYCEGDEFDDLSISLEVNQEVRWFTNTGLTNPLEIEVGNADGSLVSAIDLFGYHTVIGGEDEDFYFVLVTETNLEGGCESDPVQVRFIGRDIPDAPVVILDNSTAGGMLSNSLVEFNYCTDSQAMIENIELESLDGDDESYYIITYEENGELQTESGITNESIDLGSIREMDLVPGAQYEFDIVRVTNDNSFAIVGSEFEGCVSTATTVVIRVHSIPSAPVGVQFSDNPNEVGDRIVYYMCQGDDIPDIRINPPLSVNEYLYEWYEDPAEANQITIADSQGDRITEQDLEGASFQFDRNTADTYSMFVKINSDVREDASFQGCSSNLTRLDLVVSPTAQNPTISASDGTVVLPENGFSHAFSFCVEAGQGILSDVVFGADAGAGQELIRWYRADEFGSSLISANPIAFGNQATAGDLGIANSENGTFYFAATHNTGEVASNAGFDGFDGCVSNPIFFSVDITTIPEPSFSFNGITEGEGTTFNFFEPNATSIALSGGLTFEIHDEQGDLVGSHVANNLNSFVHFFESEGIYSGTLHINTSTNCGNTVMRRFRVLERIVISGDSYQQDFDSNDGGWFVEFQNDDGLSGSTDDPVRGSSWVLGTPNGTTINESASGDGNVWSTTGSVGDSYLGGERSYVYSPAFDISGLTNPALRLQTIRDFDTKDGVVLQYSFDDGLTWVTLGDYIPGGDPPSTGQFWYTENGISSVPGDLSVGGGVGFNPERVGWASKPSPTELLALQSSNGWANSTHSLASIVEKRSVRFRIALASSGAATDEKTGDGFGFDNFELFSQTRTLLIEQFSSSLSPASVAVNNILTGLVDSEQITYINYFTDLGNGGGRGRDEINGRNTADPAARSVFYGVSTVPRSVIDGDLFEVQVDANTGQEIMDEPSFNANDINIKSLEPPLFTIEGVLVSFNTQEGIISMSASFVPQYTAETSDLSFYFGLVETIEVGELDNEGNMIEPIGDFVAGDRIVNALRVLLPNATGFNYVGDVVSNASDFDYSVDWFVDNLYNTDGLKLVVFVQDNETKEVLQSMSSDVLGVSEIITGLKVDQFDKVYPNPASHSLTVSFATPLSADSYWNLIDASGKVVLNGVVIKGSSELHLKTAKIPSGVYFVSLFSEENNQKVARVIIEH